MLSAFVLLPLAVVYVVAVVLLHIRRHEAPYRAKWGRFLLVVVLVGLACFVFGAFAGAAWSCRTWGGQLCVLAGLFGTGPVLCACFLLVAAEIWSARADASAADAKNKVIASRDSQ